MSSLCIPLMKAIYMYVTVKGNPKATEKTLIGVLSLVTCGCDCSPDCTGLWPNRVLIVIISCLLCVLTDFILTEAKNKNV